MRVTIEGADLLKYYLTYAYPIDGSLSSRFRNWYIATNCDSVPPQLGYGLSNIQENCWPTKINIAVSANADSIEEARFPDGYYITTVKVWSHSGDSAVALDTVLVDNFNPRVKQTDPPDWFAFVPTKKHKVWCIFSEQMDKIQDISVSGYQREGHQDIRISGKLKSFDFYSNFSIINYKEV